MSEDEREAVVAAEVGMPVGTETLLVVEDDDGVRQVGVRILQALGYTVLEASDGDAALEMLRHHRDVRLLLSDVVLPRIGRRALAEQAVRL